MTMLHTGPVGFRSAVEALPRIHVYNHEWGMGGIGASDFWFFPNSGIITTGSAALLSSHGWNASGTLSVVAPAGADFLEVTDQGTPAGLILDAAGELLQSPYLFGWWPSAYFLRGLLGAEPQMLIAEFYAQFPVANNNETATGIGFIEAGGSANVAAHHIAVIASNGTQFVLRSDAASTNVGTVDNAWHLWRITVRRDGVTVLRDGEPSGGVLPLKTDEWPAAFGAGILASTGANRINWGPTHIWYAV